MPNFMDYHKSLSHELHSLKDRVRNLVQHWGTDGEFKEAALRTVLRRHLPSSLLVGRGFVVGAGAGSTQIDILVVNANKPVLFRDGDLMIVTPDCVAAAVEVKTTLRTASEVEEAATKLAKVGALCAGARPREPWLGLFSYDEALRNTPTKLLDAVELAYQETRTWIHCAACGPNQFLRFWDANEFEPGEDPQSNRGPVWRVYSLENLASAYFIGNLIDGVAQDEASNARFAWFPIIAGKLAHRVGEKRLPEHTP